MHLHASYVCILHTTSIQTFIPKGFNLEDFSTSEVTGTARAAVPQVKLQGSSMINSINADLSPGWLTRRCKSSMGNKALPSGISRMNHRLLGIPEHVLEITNKSQTWGSQFLAQTCLGSTSQPEMRTVPGDAFYEARLHSLRQGHGPGTFGWRWFFHLDTVWLCIYIYIYITYIHTQTLFFPHPAATFWRLLE